MNIRDFALERFFAEHEFSVSYHLSGSDCESLTVADVLDMAGEDPSCLLQLRLGYTEYRGDPALREVIAGYYPECNADDVLVTNAPSEAIFLAMQAALQSGDRVIVQTPCYQSLLELPRSMGCEIVTWPLRLGQDAWRLDLDALERSLPGAAMLVFNAPHNPTGHQPSPGEAAQVLELARKHGVRVFADEMYRGLEPRPELALIPPASRDDRAVCLWGMSKTFGLPGLRMGWLVSRDHQFLDRVARFKDYTTISSSAPGELLTRIALGCGDQIMSRNRAIIARNVKRVEAFTAEHEDVMSWLPPQAGPVTLARIHGESATSFCDRSRRDARVLMVPSRLFDMEDQHVRLGLGRAGFGEALNRLDAWLRSSTR